MWGHNRTPLGESAQFLARRHVLPFHRGPRLRRCVKIWVRNLGEVDLRVEGTLSPDRAEWLEKRAKNGCLAVCIAIMRSG